VLWTGPTGTLVCRIGRRSLTVEVDAGSIEQLRSGDRVTLGLERYVLLDPLDGFAIGE
jgi:hypothetical protein